MGGMGAAHELPRADGRVAGAIGVLAGWGAVAVLWGAALALAMLRLNRAPGSDLAPLALFWIVAYAGVTAPAAVLGLLVGLRRGGLPFKRGATLGAGLTCLLLLCVSLLFRWLPASQAVSRKAYTPMGLVDLLLLAGIFLLFAGALGRGVVARRAGTAARLALLGVVLVVGAQVANRIYETPTRVDLAQAVAPLVERDPACAPRPGPVSGVTVLALDGMSWSVAAPMLAEGAMPHLAHLLGRAAYGNLDTFFPSYSPVVWATIAGGLPESEHGVHAFLQTRLPGVATPLSRGPYLNSFAWWGGANELLSRLVDHGFARAEPLPSSAWHGLALWDVAGHNGHRVGVYDWMNTWPVSQVDGYMFTKHVRGHDQAVAPPGSAWPPDALRAVLESLQPLSRPPADPWFQQYWEAWEEAWALDHAFSPSVSLNFNKATDSSQNFWAGGVYGAFVVPEHPPYQHFPERIRTAYRLQDEWIGRFADALPEDQALVIVSDHGFEFNGTNHAFLPPGVIIAAGGPFACASLIPEADVYDVAPTLLAILGLPGLEAMPGDVVHAAFADGRGPTLERRAEYPAEWKSPTVEVDDGGADWNGLRERLKSLGYVN